MIVCCLSDLIYNGFKVAHEYSITQIAPKVKRPKPLSFTVFDRYAMVTVPQLLVKLVDSGGRTVMFVVMAKFSASLKLP